MKKVVSMLLIVAVMISMVACSKPSAPSGSGEVAQTGTLQKVLKNKKLVAGVILSFPPFGFKDEAGEPQGYDVDLAKELAESLGAELEIVEVTADARVSSLETGKVDVIFGNFTRTLERSQKVNFSDPYVVAGERLLVKKDSGIKNVEDLTGKKVAVTKGSTNAELMAKLNPNAEVVFFETSAEALVAVKNGQAATFLEDSNFQQFQAAQDDTLEVVGDSLIALEYNCIGAKKGDPDWLTYLNYYVFEINKSGKNDEVYRKWFGESLPFSLTDRKSVV